ncbi:MAG TPA: monovalent cation/H+ antiporter complex subunit F [Verrucomicrobiae bacterium]|nr:monovalent cation/H+ antiporter complex subunit F [Verrucomicrobiae bacterium]
MSVWLWADVALLLCTVPCVVLLLSSRKIEDWAVALQMAGLISVLALIVLAEAMQRPSFLDLAMALGLLSFPAGLVFAHFLEHWFK